MWYRQRAVEKVLGLSVSLGLLLAQQTLAVESDERTSPRLLDLAIPQVLTPSRFPQRLDESPSTVTVIDRALIEASGARRLVDVLRLVPGFHVGYKFNQQPTAGYHGLADEFARRTLLLIDGQRIFQYSRGIIEWNNIPLPLENVERIEVIRGPNAAVYGSNALQAVIDIQTRSPAEDKGFTVRGTLGTQDVMDGFARFGGQFKTLDYAVSLFSKNDSKYDGVPDNRSNYGITLVGELPITESSTVKLKTGYIRGDYEAANVSSLPADPFDPARHYSISNSYQSLEWRQVIDERSELTATLAHNYLDSGDHGYRNSTLLPGTTLNLQFDMQEERYHAEINYTRISSDRFRFVTGIGYHYEEVVSSFFFNTDAKIDNNVFRLFAHGEYRLSDRLVVNAGAMLESSEISSKDWLVLPRLSAHYHVAEGHTLRAVASTGSRQPTLYENQSEAVIRGVEQPITLFRAIASGAERGGLKPELVRSFELGYQWLPSKNINLDVRIFNEHISDLIVQFFRPGPPQATISPTGLVLDFDNERDIDIRGIEAQLDWRNEAGLRVFASYAYTDIDAEGTRFNNGYEDSAPRHSFGLLVNQEFANGWSASVNYDYQSAMQWYLDEPINDYHKLDARIAKRFRIGGSELTTELVGTNLLGPISDYLSDQESDQGLWFRVSLEY